MFGQMTNGQCNAYKRSSIAMKVHSESWRDQQGHSRVLDPKIGFLDY